MIIFFKIISFNKKNLVLMIFNLKILKKMNNKMINGKILTPIIFLNLIFNRFKFKIMKYNLNNQNKFNKILKMISQHKIRYKKK